MPSGDTTKGKWAVRLWNIAKRGVSGAVPSIHRAAGCALSPRPVGPVAWRPSGTSEGGGLISMYWKPRWRP